MSSDIVDEEIDLQQNEVKLHGLLVAYKDDQLNDRVKSALKRKSRVRYKCMDTFSNLLAFGTSGGAIYLFKLKSVRHSSCNLSLLIPCDQGSIETIKFLPNPETDDLLVAIGTLRGSLVIFKLSQLPNEDNPVCTEIYKAQSFTNNCAIKLIECDQNLFGLCCSFTKLYICDVANRLYVLDSSTIYANKSQTIRLFYSSHLPSLIFSVNDSKINQISVHLSQLLISTDETTRLFNEQTNQIDIIGKKKRKDGFYGACFFNPAFKPARILQVGHQQHPHQADNSNYSSTGSINELENLNIFVSRPMFRLWQVDHRREVKFTHQFDKMIRNSASSKDTIELHNEPISEDDDDSGDILDNFLRSERETNCRPLIKSTHFQKLVQIYSSTLGNLLLSYTKHELFVIDPIGAKLIVSHSQEAPIVQVCCNENELFIWSQNTNSESTQFRIKRLVLLAPTQFVLELHRLHRYISLVTFVQLFADIFRYRMALPLSGIGVITIEGGLLRNILLNAWDMYNSRKSKNISIDCKDFERMVEEIVEESKQLKMSFEDLTNSRFFLTMTNENIDRLCTEPYASLVSLEVSIKNLHTDYVIHFNQDALNRHKSVVNLSRSIQNLKELREKTIQSNHDLSKHQTQGAKNKLPPRELLNSRASVVEIANTCNGSITSNLENQDGDDTGGGTAVAIEVQELRDSEPLIEQAHSSGKPKNASLEKVAKLAPTIEEVEEELSKEPDEAGKSRELERMKQSGRCTNCYWPRAKSHHRQMDSAQLIQLRWLEENLMSNFEENIGKIERLAFKHGLWRIFLKSLAYRNQTEEYITCCMLLDDVRLLDIEQFVIVHCGEFEILDRLLFHLGRKLELLGQAKERSTNDVELTVCLKCGRDQEPLPPLNDSDYDEDEDEQEVKRRNWQHEDEHSYNLVNLYDLFMRRRNADVKKMISCLLEHPKVFNNSTIPSTFYLKALTTAVLKVKQSSQSRSKLKTIIN